MFSARDRGEVPATVGHETRLMLESELVCAGNVRRRLMRVAATQPLDPEKSNRRPGNASLIDFGRTRDVGHRATRYCNPLFPLLRTI